MSKEILLISPPYPTEGRKVTPPLGIASIAGYLEENGYRGRVDLVDGFCLASKHGYRKSLEMVKERISSEKPFVVGCSILYTNEQEALQVMEAATSAGSHVIAGNYMATYAHESYSRLATAVVRGEGELTTKEVVDALFNDRELNGIRGITFFDGKKVVANPYREPLELNALPPPAYHLLPSPSEYALLLVEESRGCCFRCSFCSIAKAHPGYGLKSAERIRCEVERIVQLGVRDIELVGELVLLQEERALRIAETMGELNCGWKIDAHPALVAKRKEILPILKEKGLRVIETGVESGNRHSLKLYNKQTTPEINEEAITSITQSGIFPLVDFINFEPYMTMKDLSQNIQFVMRHLRVLSKAPSYPLENLFKPWVPIPGTPLFQKAAQDGLIVTTNEGVADSYLKMTNAKHYFRFKDEKVKKATDLIDYFLVRHGQRYHRMFEQITEENRYGLSYDEDPKNAALAIVPAYILCMAYAVVENQLSQGKMIVDWYSQQTLDAIERGEYEKEPSPLHLPEGAWEGILEVFQRLSRKA